MLLEQPPGSTTRHCPATTLLWCLHASSNHRGIGCKEPASHSTESLRPTSGTSPSSSSWSNGSSARGTWQVSSCTKSDSLETAIGVGSCPHLAKQHHPPPNPPSLPNHLHHNGLDQIGFPTSWPSFQCNGAVCCPIACWGTCPPWSSHQPSL